MAINMPDPSEFGKDYWPRDTPEELVRQYVLEQGEDFLDLLARYPLPADRTNGDDD